MTKPSLRFRVGLDSSAWPSTSFVGWTGTMQTLQTLHNLFKGRPGTTSSICRQIDQIYHDLSELCTVARHKRRVIPLEYRYGYRSIYSWVPFSLATKKHEVNWYVVTSTANSPLRASEKVDNKRRSLQRRQLRDWGIIQIGHRCYASRAAQAQHDPTFIPINPYWWALNAARKRSTKPKLPTILLVAIFNYPRGVYRRISATHGSEGAEARRVSLPPLSLVLALLALLEWLSKHRHLTPFRSADLFKRLNQHSRYSSVNIVQNEKHYCNPT